MDKEKVTAFLKKYRTPILLGVAAVALYFGYRWYKNRQSGSAQGNAGSGLGSNLNSVAPELIAGSSGPASGLNYYAGSTVVDLAQQSPQSATVTPPSPGQPMMDGGQPQPTDTEPDQDTGTVPGKWVPPTNDTVKPGTVPPTTKSGPATSVNAARTMPRSLNTAPHSTSMAVKRTPLVMPRKRKIGKKAKT